MDLTAPPMLEALLQSRAAEGWGGLWHGVYPAVVVDIKDPDSQGRVKVRLPWSPDAAGAPCELWARLATLMGGDNRGSWFIPDVDDEVLVAFEAGHAFRPYVIGALWNGHDSPPESMDASGRNDKKVIRSRNGVKLILDDQDGQEQFIVETPGGQKVTLKDGPGSVELRDSNGNTVRLETAGVTIVASTKVTVQASQVSVSASTVQVDAGMSTFSGVVKADTVLCNSIISASYTPGAGNIW
ncbi:phage tail protein [Caballeronia novacaledonica]|uniref:phage baseplate assembly protein V n=1 Tax=Caballeronia novacaledonica TaxID=1544861 RepID=UPI001EE23129|nr:phage baseplate assembly protein V [Caballeronia novacaledonica]GJH13044.1 phage tail protein [Caballeronia novacaledonica]